MVSDMPRFALIIALLVLAPCVSQAQDVTAIRAGTVLDVGTGQTTQNVVILVRGNRIEAMGTSVAIPDGARVVDLSDKFVLPGLMDAHTHLLIQPDYSTNNPIQIGRAHV